MKKATRWLAVFLCVALFACAPVQAESAASYPPDGLYTIGVDSSASMFRVVRCLLQVEDGAMTATLTMSGSGYGYLYPGTGEEADAAPVEDWIPYREDAEGRHVFTLPLSALDGEMAVASYSIKYSKWYDRTLVFRSETLRETVQIAEDGTYQGTLSSNTALDGVACTLTAAKGAMTVEFDATGIGELALDGEDCTISDGVCRAALSSLDLRLPVALSVDGETQEGWVKLDSAALTAGGVRVENGVYAAQVETDSALLRFSDCQLAVDDTGMTAVLTARQNRFDAVYPGAAEDARADEAGWITAVPNEEGTYTYTVEIASLDNDLPLAVYSSQQKMWQERTIRIDAASLVRLEDEEEAAAEGNAPDSFSFSGGSGRVEITCPEISFDAQGQATATIVFDSPNYPYVRVNGQQYDCICDAETSRVEIPVELNRSFAVYGTTTAMSAAHEVEYTLYISMNASAGEGEAELAGLTWESSLPLTYAEGFSVDYYAGGYALIDVVDGERYFVVPEGMAAPEGLDPQIIVLQQPLDRVYLAATSAMSLFDAMNALDTIRLSGTAADGWYIENARAAMERDDMLFAGKYSEPDFELLLTEDCDLAIESTMIFHTPQVKEMIELLGIPVFVDRSSYEAHPLGRTEWIKLYGVLMDKEEAACAFFDEQAHGVEALEGFENTEKTVAFFYIHSNGSVVVRSPSDYISRMIELAGGRYAFSALDESSSNRSTIAISMEEFYDTAVNADFLIYNAAIDDPPESIDELLTQSALFADCKAVQEGNVWCADKSLYQRTDIVGSMIADIHRMLTGENGDMTFLKKLS